MFFRSTIGVMMALLACGCSGDQTVKMTDDNNYDFLADVSAEAQTIASQTDQLVDWSGLTTDLLGREMDPSTDLDIVRMIRFTLSEAEVIDGINIDNLRQSDVSGNADYTVEGTETSAMLATFKFLDSDFPVDEELVDSTDAYLMSAITHTETGGEDYRMFTFVDPIDGEAATDIFVTSDSADLDYEIDIEGATAITFKADSDSYVVDWSSLTLDGSGQTISLSNIDSVMLASYSMTIAEIEGDFLMIEENADVLYQANVEGLGAVDLTTLTDSTGASFSGFDGSDTWIFALRCGGCISPAPLFLTTVETE